MSIGCLVGKHPNNLLPFPVLHRIHIIIIITMTIVTFTVIVIFIDRMEEYMDNHYLFFVEFYSGIQWRHLSGLE